MACDIIRQRKFGWEIFGVGQFFVGKYVVFVCLCAHDENVVFDIHAYILKAKKFAEPLFQLKKIVEKSA